MSENTIAGLIALPMVLAFFCIVLWLATKDMD